MEEAKYPLLDSDSEQGEHSSIERNTFRDSLRRPGWVWYSKRWSLEAWKCSTFVCATVSFGLLIALVLPRGNVLGSYEEGFSTDMGE
jgi:hypothetical protein